MSERNKARTNEPAGYIRIKINGVVHLIPYYAT